MPNSFMLESTGQFLYKLNDFKFCSNHVMVSFDVVSLFTNVPLNDTIDIIANFIYSDIKLATFR